MEPEARLIIPEPLKAVPLVKSIVPLAGRFNVPFTAREPVSGAFWPTVMLLKLAVVPAPIEACRHRSWLPRRGALADDRSRKGRLSQIIDLECRSDRSRRRRGDFQFVARPGRRERIGPALRS